MTTAYSAEGSDETDSELTSGCCGNADGRWRRRDGVGVGPMDSPWSSSCLAAACLRMEVEAVDAMKRFVGDFFPCKSRMRSWAMGMLLRGNAIQPPVSRRTHRV